MFNMNRLDTATRSQVIAALVEGNSIRSTSRMTDVARNTVSKLLVELGAACSDYLNRTLVNLPCKRIQCDEIWSFIGAKQKNVPEVKRGEWGDCWTWRALDADAKLIVGYAIGPRTALTAYDFVKDVAERLSNRVQLTTDGHRVYLNAVDYAFGIDVDYAMLDKHYGVSGSGDSAAIRYSPAKFTGAKRAIITGDPDPKHISTSYVERQNLTMRMHMRRFTRLTNGFSKKIEMHAHNIALHFAYYNFCKIHQALRVTPAMEARLSNHVWSLEELLGLLSTVVGERRSA
jgi:IS1 family transposase